jgi:hypothetical protein
MDAERATMLATAPISRCTLRASTRILTGAATLGDLAVDPAVIADLDLLPSWYEDWVLGVRERVRLRLLHALEELSRQLR